MDRRAWTNASRRGLTHRIPSRECAAQRLKSAAWPPCHPARESDHPSRSGGRWRLARRQSPQFRFAHGEVELGEAETRELVPSMPPQFASPEQRENRAARCSLGHFSLGATDVVLAERRCAVLWRESNPRLSAPDVPRFVRNLVSHMLRTDPEQRPQDLGAFAERIRACLQKAERRTAFTRSFAPAAIPGTQKVEKKRVAPALALAAAIVVLAAFGAFYLPERLANRERKPLGD